MHIGLIGGIGPAATVIYYERIVKAFAEAGKTLHLTIGHSSAAILSRNNSEGRAAEQAEEFLRVTKQLAAAGADKVVISSMGGHFCVNEFAAVSPLPMISGPEAVAAYVLRENIKRIGILGTRIVMQTALYGALEPFGPITPKGDDLEQVHDDYVSIAVAGAATDDQRDRLIGAGQKLVNEQGAEAVLLGGTDLSLVYNCANVDFRVIDSAIVHADAIAAEALADA